MRRGHGTGIKVDYGHSHTIYDEKTQNGPSSESHGTLLIKNTYFSSADVRIIYGKSMGNVPLSSFAVRVPVLKNGKPVEPVTWTGNLYWITDNGVMEEKRNDW